MDFFFSFILFFSFLFFSFSLAPAPQRAVAPELLEELIKLFPNKSTRDLTIAAASAAGPLLEDAVFQVSVSNEPWKKATCSAK